MSARDRERKGERKIKGDRERRGKKEQNGKNNVYTRTWFSRVRIPIEQPILD